MANQLAPHQLAYRALNRFSIGAKSGEYASAHTDPRGWVGAQLDEALLPSLLAPEVSSQQLLAQVQLLQKQKRAEREGREAPIDPTTHKPYERVSNKLPIDTFNRFNFSLIEAQMNTSNGVLFRLLDFFSNHFSVSRGSDVMKVLSVTFEREAILPHILGRFDSLLIAVEQHPAMLVYLNNERSFGPNSPKGKKSGLNENLAREILELHTLGVNGGYTQSDVTEMAKAITGWSIGNSNNGEIAGFAFRKQGHEPGSRTVLGKTFVEGGQSQGEAVLSMLANHPSTARHVSTKLARYFIDDTPPMEVIDAMVDTWLNTGGELTSVLNTLIFHNLTWQSQERQFKTPREFMVSTLRALDTSTVEEKLIIPWLRRFGQPPLEANSPAGYSDFDYAWDSSYALLTRVDWIDMLTRRVPLDIESLMVNTGAAYFPPQRLMQIENAGNRELSASLMLLSPDFLYR